MPDENLMPSRTDKPTGKIVITGAAGLVGQNLVVRLKDAGYTNIVCIDKHPANTPALARMHPDLTVIQADLARDDGWQDSLEGAAAVIQMHAQIGGLDWAEFVDNNITATERVLAAMQAADVPYLVHASSSVVNSMAVDFYTESKKAQEKLVDACPIPHVTLRPTLMFGWFDRKHLGWLARFMQRVPVFPIPGSGRYIRQPLYVGDFSAIIIACLEGRRTGTYDISGQQKITYIELIRALRKAVGAKTPLLRIPYGLFHALLSVYALVDRNPPFTTKQLKALVTPDEFIVIDWPGIFGVQSTPLDEALSVTFNDPRYAGVVLDF
ncbi:NADH-ubiquinone oxidoreductase 39-40 kDa subunit-like protein [Nitrospirillum viridazoti Y2]|uniref:Nucleoside-diphosphate-sugar epimerase n=1 Tax=Nitrospirillum amazonense TaxID=28077 RepID=A0A560HXU1_9PROT|nr:NAD-dependent epimerase/dehydratase family protein [Nitrospirillum amazonense]EGY01534.1 NADH-ubiquinone oxidoreductase 39-40 kDa subunit-like protein [Nitrospirillum amazonense Y2]TWB51463.1 nucleoside-diphosphate-sugar epimerase [Nitrospirillum amazonense]